MAKTETETKTKQVAKPTADQGILALKQETADLILKKVEVFQKEGELHLPDNYSAPNALKSAWLQLQNIVDKNKNPVLAVCTKASIANTMLDMVIQGLNPAKKQCYFIPYGKELTLMRSYLGTIAVCLRVNPNIADIFAEVIYGGDKLSYKIQHGRRVINDHIQDFANIRNDNIIGAYAVAIGVDDTVIRSVIMTIEDIKQSWRQSAMNPIDDKGNIKAGTTHAKFPGEMCKRTAVNRLAKIFIGQSNDEYLKESMGRTDEDAIKKEVDLELDEKANTGDVIEITSEPLQKTKNPEPKKQTTAPTKQVNNSEPEPLSEAERAEILAEEALAAQGGPGF